jgi:hypothetical protein
MYTTSTAFLEALAECGVTFLFSNFGSDHPPILEALAGARAEGRRLPRVITCPNEMVALSAAYKQSAVRNHSEAPSITPPPRVFRFSFSPAERSAQAARAVSRTPIGSRARCAPAALKRLDPARCGMLYRQTWKRPDARVTFSVWALATHGSTRVFETAVPFQHEAAIGMLSQAVRGTFSSIQSRQGLLTNFSRVSEPENAYWLRGIATRLLPRGGMATIQGSV